MARRIGLFGGTFDPVHNGHLSIAQSFLESGLIDELWVLLTPFPPHKQHEKQASYDLRFKMLESVFKDIENISVNTIENRLPKPSYTVQTIRHLKNEHPENSFYYCMGEDSLAHFSTWKFYTKILEECELLVAKRPGMTHENVEDQILKRTHFVSHSPLDISSSSVKEKVGSGQSVQKMVPKSVHKIIEKEQLYS